MNHEDTSGVAKFAEGQLGHLHQHQTVLAEITPELLKVYLETESAQCISK